MHKIQRTALSLAEKFRLGFYEEGYDLQSLLVDQFTEAIEMGEIILVLNDNSLRNFEALLQEFLSAIDRKDFIAAADVLEYKFEFLEE